MRAVVGVSGKYRKRSVYLFGNNGSCKLVRQRHSSQRQQQIRSGTGLRRPTICRSDGDHDGLGTAVLNFPDLRSKLLARQLASAAVEQYQVGGSPPGAPVDPLKQRRLTVPVYGLTRNVSGGPRHIICSQLCRRGAFTTGTSTPYRSQVQNHTFRLSRGLNNSPTMYLEKAAPPVCSVWAPYPPSGD